MASLTVEPTTAAHLARSLGVTAKRVGTLRVVIVAEGAGHGHALRAHALAQRFKSADIIARPGAATFLPSSARIRWHRSEGPEAARRVVAARGPDADLIVVDTFARGLFGAMHRALCPGTPWAWVRRHVRAEYDARPAAAHYDYVWLPYGPASCEWDGLEPGEYIGHPVHPIEYGGEPVRLAVIGDAALLPSAVRAVLPADACDVRPPYRAVPRARRYIVVGAGYHGVYRHLAAGHTVRFWPQPRRYDDQYWRAERVGRLLSPSHAAAWVAGAGESAPRGGVHV